LLSANDIGSMRVTDLGLGPLEQQIRLDDAVIESCSQVKDNQVVSGTQLENVIRACLREYMWCRLVGPDDSYLHFGYDYYMYVGLPKTADGLTLPRGMFLEEFESPYTSLDN
jgi:hypothetical protein